MYKEALQDEEKYPPTSQLQDGINNLHQKICRLTLSQVGLLWRL